MWLFTLVELKGCCNIVQIWKKLRRWEGWMDLKNCKESSTGDTSSRQNLNFKSGRDNLDALKKMRGVGGLLNLCQGGTCICDHQQNNVLYCYGEVSKIFNSSYASKIFCLLSGGAEEASSARWWHEPPISSGAPLPCAACPAGDIHLVVALHNFRLHFHHFLSHHLSNKVTVTLLLLFMLLILLSIRSTLASLKHQVKYSA